MTKVKVYNTDGSVEEKQENSFQNASMKYEYEKRIGIIKDYDLETEDVIGYSLEECMF